MNVEKWVEGRQNLWRVRRFFLFSGEIYPREPISNGMRFTFMSLISVTMWEYFSVFLRFAAWIFGSRGTVSSSINICSSEIITMSGVYDAPLKAEWGNVCVQGTF